MISTGRAGGIYKLSQLAGLLNGSARARAILFVTLDEDQRQTRTRDEATRVGPAAS